jgi:hypothetical protein
MILQEVDGQAACSWRNLRERDHLKHLGLDGIILKQMFKKWDGDMNWIALAQDRDR